MRPPWPRTTTRWRGTTALGPIIGGPIDGIRRVSDGHEVVPVNVAARLAAAATPPHLAPREHDVLRLIATGLTNKEIGERLSLTEGTVRIYISNSFVKLNVKRRTEAVARATELGLIAR